MGNDLEIFLHKASIQSTWSSKPFLDFCLQGTKLAKQHPQSKHHIAYAIVEAGRYFSDFDRADENEVRETIRNLAADLELHDEHVYTGDGLSVKQKWQKLERLAREELGKLE